MLELSGTFCPDRHARRRAASKSARGIGDPPACLAPDEAGAWVEFVGNAPAGVLTSGDWVALEALARLMAKSRREEGLRGAELAHLRGFLTELGASPASRGRVQAVGPPRRRRAGWPSCRRAPNQSLLLDAPSALGVASSCTTTTVQMLSVVAYGINQNGV